MNISDITLTIALMAIPTGSFPIILSLIKGYSPQRQRWILIRETLFSLLLAYLLLFLGKPFLEIAEIEPFAINLSGGVLIFLIALRMIFPPYAKVVSNSPPQREPFVFPIATPVIVGGGTIAVILVSAQQGTLLEVSIAIALAWVILFAIMMSLPFIHKVLKQRGLIVVENLMGMILLIRACDLIREGVLLFLKRVGS